MATRKKSSTKKSARKKSTVKSSPDALTLLRADHRAVDDLLKKYEKARSDSVKTRLAGTICKELSVHARIEEDLFYPALRKACGKKAADLLDEAKVEHASLKELIAQIESATPADDLYDAKVKVLGEYVKHHVKEEEGEIFPMARKSKLDLKALGASLQADKKMRSSAHA